MLLEPHATDDAGECPTSEPVPHRFSTYGRQLVGGLSALGEEVSNAISVLIHKIFVGVLTMVFPRVIRYILNHQTVWPNQLLEAPDPGEVVRNALNESSEEYHQDKHSEDNMQCSENRCAVCMRLTNQ